MSLEFERKQLDYRAKLAKKYASADLEKIEAELHHKEYKEMKKREREQPDEIIRNSSQLISQKFSQIKDKEVVPQIKKDMAQLKDVIVEFIKKELDFQPLKKCTYYDKTVSYAKIEELVQILLPVFKKYKTTQIVLEKVFKPNQNTFQKLIVDYVLYRNKISNWVDIMLPEFEKVVNFILSKPETDLYKNNSKDFSRIKELRKVLESIQFSETEAEMIINKNKTLSLYSRNEMKNVYEILRKYSISHEQLGKLLLHKSQIFTYSPKDLENVIEEICEYENCDIKDAIIKHLA